MNQRFHALTILVVVVCGCATTHPARQGDRGAIQRFAEESVSFEPVEVIDSTEYVENAVGSHRDPSPSTDAGPALRHVPTYKDVADWDEVELDSDPKPDSADQLHQSIEINDVIVSIHRSFPLVAAAYQQVEIAAGNQVTAWGGFDTKIAAASESGALGFYETYRNRAQFSRPIYEGGEFFGGYRVGRGAFQPWYLERQTNDGGEFSAGVNLPLLRNRAIDARRAELWRATYERQRANPEIRTQLILFVREGTIAYWNWVAAGQKYRIGLNALDLAQQRNDQLQRRVEVGDLDPPVLQDNRRAIAQRQASLIDLERKLDQAAIKLSLFLRDQNGQPMVLESGKHVSFPDPTTLDETQLASDIESALGSRPELAILDAEIKRVEVDLAEARNNLLPAIDAKLVGSQDVGAPTSPKRDKSEFELEAGLYLDVPVQRRKAKGKLQASRGKLAQLVAKQQFTRDKIQSEIQVSYVAVNAAFERLSRAQESLRLANYMADVERRKFELGNSDLLAVTLREQFAIEAAESEVDALLDSFIAWADYQAVMARDYPIDVSIER